jgi:hypothetical protein
VPVTNVQSAINIVQDGDGTTHTVAFSGAVTAHNLLFAMVTWSDDGAGDEDLLSVADTLGNTYTQIAPPSLVTTEGQRLAVYYKADCTGGAAPTITFTMPATGVRFFRQAACAEYAGADLTTPIDKVDVTEDGTVATGANVLTTPAVVPDSNGQVIIGAYCQNNSTSTISPGTSPNFVERQDGTPTSTDPGIQLEDLEQTTAASVAAKWTASAAGGHYNAYVVTLRAAGAAVQSLNPSADSVDGTWTNEADGTTLAASIDEDTASDTDYIQSVLSPSTSGCRVKLETGGDPASSTGHVIRWRGRKDAAGGQTIGLTVKLYQGGGDVQGAGTLIASFTRANVSNTYTDFAETLSGAEADSITNYGDLYLEFFANAT